jgi:hypothetical protein
VTASVTYFVAMEVGRRMFSSSFHPVASVRHRTFVAVIRMEVIVYVTVKVGWTMKPRTSADEDAASKPFWPVISVGGAGIGWDVVVAIGTGRGYPDTDGNLGVGFGSHRNRKSETSNNS